MQTLSELRPNPDLFFDAESHRYRFKDIWIPYSVTGITSYGMDGYVQKKIDDTKHIWGPRGDTIHACLEAFLTGAAVLNPGDYAEWVDPLLAHPLWSRFRPLAVEHRMVSKDHFYAGSFDALLHGPDKDGNETTVLVDLKTVAKASTPVRSIAKQAGAYIALLNDNHRVQVDRVIGVFAKPGMVELKVEDPDECLSSWVDHLDYFKSQQPDF